MSQPTAPAEKHPASAPPRSTPFVICLTGFMGSGKTSVGQELAQQLGCDFIDLDRMIEARAGKSVAGIFAQQGEEFFRRAEREALAEVLSTRRRPLVLSPGGGAWLQPGIAEQLAKAGAITIFLDAPAEELHQRCVNSLDAGHRPLLKDLSSFKKLYADRLPVYRRSQRRVDTSGRSVRDIATGIAEIIRDEARDS
ncbi:MAG TPA: shikimate kinase [Terriglobales bacterium]|nr:shikimate kinase [Terriglobales bacterium]